MPEDICRVKRRGDFSPQAMSLLGVVCSAELRYAWLGMAELGFAELGSAQLSAERLPD